MRRNKYKNNKIICLLIYQCDYYIERNSDMLNNTTKIRGKRIKGVTRIICRRGLQSLILSTWRQTII